MEEGCINTKRQVRFMMGNGWMVKDMDMASISLLMEIFIEGSGKRDANREKGYWSMLQGLDMMGNGKMIMRRDMESCSM